MGNYRIKKLRLMTESHANPLPPVTGRLVYYMPMKQLYILNLKIILKWRWISYKALQSAHEPNVGKGGEE